MNIVIFGDSITWGAWDIEGGWANRLKRHCNQKVINSDQEDYFAVYPLGISGNTSKDLLARLENELQARIDPDNELLVIFAIGANDSAWFDNRRNWIELEDFKKNLKKLIEKARKYTGKVVFVGLSPANEEASKPVSWDHHIEYTNDLLIKYDKEVEEIARTENLGYIPMRPLFENQQLKILIPDGIHPNTESHQLMFEKIKNHLNETYNLDL